MFFLTFSGGIEMEHWAKMGEEEIHNLQTLACNSPIQYAYFFKSRNLIGCKLCLTWFRPQKLVKCVVVAPKIQTKFLKFSNS